MQQVEVTHRYNAKPQDVWDVYTDHARWSEWAGTPGSRLAKEGSPERNGSGAVRAFAGGMREEILEFDPPKRMSTRLMVRAIAYEMQARHYGGLRPAVVRQLDKFARGDTRGKVESGPRAPALEPGARLVRE